MLLLEVCVSMVLDFLARASKSLLLATNEEHDADAQHECSGAIGRPFWLPGHETTGQEVNTLKEPDGSEHHQDDGCDT